MSDQQFVEPISLVPWVPPRNDLDTCTSATIFQLLQAGGSSSFGDNSLAFEGKKITVVTLVAHVTEVELLERKAVYILEDGTGRIYADYSFKSLNPHIMSSEVDEEEKSHCHTLEHTYVRIVGEAWKSGPYLPRIKIRFIQPVQDYHQVVHHIFDAVYNTMGIQQQIQPQSSNEDHAMDVTSLADSHAGILPNIFSPQRHKLYDNLTSLQRAIMKHMHGCPNDHILITTLSQTIQASYGCTASQFDVAFEELLLEAHITSPLDDGYVVVTPRHLENLSYDTDLPL